LFLSLPWAGHIIHLKRIASWFVERPPYEVHFGYFTKEKPDLPEGVHPHAAEEQELTPMFDEMQDAMKDMAMSEAVFGSAPPSMVENGEDFENQGVRVMRFFIRMVLKVKPTVVVADSGFSVGGFLPAICKLYNASFLFVNSPGIKEKWVEDVKAKEEVERAELAQAPTQAPSGLAAEAAKIDFAKVMTGTFDVSTLPPNLQLIAKIPGFDMMKMMQFFMAVMKPDPSRPPRYLYPSSSWMVEDQPINEEYFTGTLLPLPDLVDGEVCLKASALQKVLDNQLYDWLLNEASQDPVVYIAFGTIVKGVREIVDKLFAALDGGRWRVLWSLPTDMHSLLPRDLPSDRWCIRSFVPQKDIFRCERVRCFISHCGANSTIEAMACGVPMVCHPFFMDQYEWARTVRKHLRAGVQVDKFDSGPEAIRLAVTEVLQEPAYRAAAQAVSKRLQAQAVQIADSLGPEMKSKEKLGPGVAVIAGMILALMKGKDVKEVAKLVQQTN